MRLIDADKAIEQIDDIFSIVDTGGLIPVGMTKALVRMMLTIESITPTIGGWISVDDRLPENETEVIIIVQHKIGWYRAFAWHDGYGWHSSAEEFGDGESDYVTYWMPLPEPPEEVTGDDA